MSEMLERVAIAIVEKIRPALEGGPPVAAKDVARAAIEAMREPTDAMCEAGDMHQGRIDWRLAIDEALR